MGEFDIAITGTRVIELTIAQELSAAYKNIIVLEKKYYDLFSNPKLKEILYKNRVERIVVTGLYTEICVFGTAQRAFTEGFQILVPSDLVASVAEREDLCKSALKIMDGYFADVVTSTKIFLE